MEHRNYRLTFWRKVVYRKVKLTLSTPWRNMWKCKYKIHTFSPSTARRLWVVRLKTEPHYKQGKSSTYPLNKRLGRHLKSVWTFRTRDNLLSPLRNRTPFPDCEARNLVNTCSKCAISSSCSIKHRSEMGVVYTFYILLNWNVFWYKHSIIYISNSTSKHFIKCIFILYKRRHSSNMWIQCCKNS